jgi:hypothetical protein
MKGFFPRTCHHQASKYAKHKVLKPNSLIKKFFVGLKYILKDLVGLVNQFWLLVGGGGGLISRIH